MNNLPLSNLNSTEIINNKPLSEADFQATGGIRNWSGNINYSTNKIFYPESVSEVQALVKKYPKLKSLGTRHCFNQIADSRDYFLSTRNLNHIVDLDTDKKTVTVEGGIKYGELAPLLHAKGFGLSNLASLPHISVAGSIITATHGSGVGNGNLATSVVGLEMVLADGSIHNFSPEKDGDLFNGVVVNLGALGIVTKVTLALEANFNMRQNIYVNLPLYQLKENFENIVTAGYSVSIFTHWLNENLDQVWIKTREDKQNILISGSDFYGAVAARQQVHPIAEMPSENCTDQLGIVGPWHERLPHFKMGFMPSSGQELQSEYFIPHAHAVEAILAVARIGTRISPYLFVSEIRTIDADNFWMSPCYQQPCVAIHFTWKQDWPAVSQLLPVIENELAPFDARAHWGKLFSQSPRLISELYPKMPDFKELILQLDPEEKFRNEFLDTVIFGT